MTSCCWYRTDKGAWPVIVRFLPAARIAHIEAAFADPCDTLDPPEGAQSGQDRCGSLFEGKATVIIAGALPVAAAILWTRVLPQARQLRRQSPRNPSGCELAAHQQAVVVNRWGADGKALGGR